MSKNEQKLKNIYGKHNGNEYKYICDVLDSEDRESRKTPYVGKLENAFSNLTGTNYAIAHNSGTSTLHTSLIAAGVGPGDEVISPAHTVIMCTFAILHQNATPIYADIERDTFNIDPDDIERKITDKTKAIIAVHMHGLPCNMKKIMEIANRHKIKVIEDSAQCVLGSIDGNLVGTLGHLASFSLETKKHLSAGEGGIVTTNDQELATRVRKAGGLGYKTLSGGQALRAILPEQFQDPNYKRHDVLGWNYRMNELTAAVALAQVERAEFLVNRRIEVAKLFDEAIKNCSWMRPQYTPEGFKNTYWTYTLLYFGDEFHGVSWKDFWKMYKDAGGDGFYGGLSVVYHEPIISSNGFTTRLCPHLTREELLYNGTCPVAEEIQPKMMQFKANYRNLDIAKEQTKILSTIIDQLGRN